MMIKHKLVRAALYLMIALSFLSDMIAKPLDTEAADLLYDYDQTRNDGVQRNQLDKLYAKAISFTESDSVDKKIVALIVLRDAPIKMSSKYILNATSSSNQAVAGVAKASILIQRFNQNSSENKDIISSIKGENNFITRIFLVNYFSQNNKLSVKDLRNLFSIETNPQVRSEIMYSLLKYHKADVTDEEIKTAKTLNMPLPTNLSTVLAFITPNRSPDPIKSLPSAMVSSMEE